MKEQKCPKCGTNILVVVQYDDRTEYWCLKCRVLVYIEYI